MSSLTKELKVKISADANGLKGALNGISNDISKVGKDFNGLKRVGEGLSGLGKKLTMGLTLPIAGIGVASAKTASDFQGAMQEVSAISGATGKDLESLSDLAKEMGRTTKFSASESAEALKYMGMAGWKTEEMIKGLPSVLSLAAAGGTDLATTSDIVTDGMTAMGIAVEDTKGFVDIMAATCSNANTNIELMGETLKYVGPVAGSLGISMDDLSLAIGLMGNAGLKGSQAGTSLRAGLTNLIKPTEQMEKAMKKYGVEVVKTGSGSVDLMGTMDNLREKLGGLDETTQAAALATIFGKEAMSGWSSIVNASEKDFEKLSTAILESNGAAEKMANTMMQGSQGAIVEMKSALEGVAITIGERLTPFLEKLADGVSTICTWFQNLSPAAQTFLMIIAALVAALGPLLLLIGGAITLFANLSIVAGALGIGVGALVAPFGIAIAVIGAIIAAGFLLVSNWDLIKAKASELASNISNRFNEAKNKAIEIFGNIKQGIEDKINGAKDAVSRGIEKIKGLFNFEWSLPKLKLPHFSVSGSFSLNPPSAPKFGIDWYSKGAIFKRPTVLGGMGVGDAHNGIGSNAEAILPINQLPKLLGLDKLQESKSNSPIVVNTILDGKTIAQTIASYSDVVSGNRMNLTERGLVL